MKNRILFVSLKDIKAVNKGTIYFPDYDIAEKGDLNDGKCGLLGVYGQNGSGKTTLYDCFDLLKLLSINANIYKFDETKGRKDTSFSYLVNMFSNQGDIEFGFLIYSNQIPYKVIYKLTLGSIFENNKRFIKIKKENIVIYRYFESGERWKYPFAEMTIDFEEEGFKYLYDGRDHDIDYVQNIKNDFVSVDLFATKKNCIDYGKSFIFSDSNLSYLMRHSKEDVRVFGSIISELRHQIGFKMFLFGHNYEPLSRVGLGSILGTSMVDNGELHGAFHVSLEPFYIRADNFAHYKKFIEQINIFISSFVPGFTAIATKIGNRNINGNEQVQIVIQRYFDEHNSLPLSEESSGIRKLFFISCALIYIYGNENGWLIVDELDSGVYEDLLGQILKALENNGKGQILFTAHNLVPLERIDPHSIVFTTYNINNRFINIKGLSNTSNLRDIYLRAIKLGGQKEQLSSKVETYDIEIALYNAYKAFQKYKDK